MPAFPMPSLGESYDPSPQREYMRGILAFSLVALVAIEITFAFIFIRSDSSVEPFRELFGLIFGATTTLLGTAIGFYFGEKSAQRGGNQT